VSAAVRQCIVCGESIEDKRADAIYCGNTCAQRAGRDPARVEYRLSEETGRLYQEHGIFDDGENMHTEEAFTVSGLLLLVHMAEAGLLPKLKSMLVDWYIENGSHAAEIYDPAVESDLSMTDR